ncbi:hypothetical protein FS847_00935 [Streptomyces sp. ISID311]|nr:hypothetical protein FS847_00935 [Streptomyces sp. ISID311]
MDSDITLAGAAVARHARFGKLPERSPCTDTVEEKPVNPRKPAGDAYNPEGSWMNLSCFASDLDL